jgi:hypothetical protein
MITYADHPAHYDVVSAESNVTFKDQLPQGRSRHVILDLKETALENEYRGLSGQAYEPVLSCCGNATNFFTS